MSACLLDEFIWRRKIAGEAETRAEARIEVERLGTMIKEVEDFQQKKELLRYRLDAIAELQKKRITTYESLMAALPTTADKPYINSLTASGNLFHVDGAAARSEDVDAYLEHLKASRNLEIVSQTLTHNRFNDFAVHGRRIR